jgi:hypothetical protein
LRSSGDYKVCKRNGFHTFNGTRTTGEGIGPILDYQHAKLSPLTVLFTGDCSERQGGTTRLVTLLAQLQAGGVIFQATGMKLG